MSCRERRRLADIQAAIDAIRSHLQRGNLNDGLIFDAVRISGSSRDVRGSGLKDVTASQVRTMYQLLVVDTDENGSASVAGCAAGEEPGTAAAETEFLDELSDGAQACGCLGVAEDEAASVSIHTVEWVSGLP